MELKIKKFTDITTLTCEKDRLLRKNKEWLTRMDELRSFYNGRPIMTDDEADEDNLDEITNHLIGYSNMQVTENRYYSIWSTSNKIVDVQVLKGDLNERTDQSSNINKYLNQAIYKSTRFGAFFRSVCGEISMAGRAACIHKEDADWCPTVSPKILLPDTVGTDSSELSYAFAPRELTEAELEQMLSNADSSDEDDDEDDLIEKPVEINRKVIRQLIDTISSQVNSEGATSVDGEVNEDHSATNSDGVEEMNRTTVNVWYYYEVRYDEDVDGKVVDLLIFTDEFRDKDGDGDDTSLFEVVAYYPSFYSSPSEWLHLIVVDASIGGDKRFSAAKGIAEITYNSDVDSEELLNRIFSGEKMRAMPRYQLGPETTEDKLLGWNPEESTLVPAGLIPFKQEGGTGGLHNPLTLLRQNSSMQSGSSFSNTGREGELRTQSIERQSNSQVTATSRVSDLSKSLEIILHEIVRRFFVGETTGGSPGYEEIMWFRKQMKDRDIDLKKLAEQTYGFYDNIEVTLVKPDSTGDIEHDLAVAQHLMSNLQHFPAAVRPFIVKKYTNLITGDPDFSDQLVEFMPKIVSAQRVTAESEFEQISRDASLGIETPIGEDDVHQEHAQTHNKHLMVIINRAKLRPLTREDAILFAGIQMHNQMHIAELMANNSSRAEGEIILQEFQEIVAEGDRLFAEVYAAEEDEQALGEDIEKQLKVAEQQRKQQETDIKAADVQSIIEQRAARQEDNRRKADQNFLLQKEKFDEERRAQPTQ